MVLVVRKDLHMRCGKIAAQVAHAALKVILEMMSKKSMLHGTMEKWSLLLSKNTPLYEWLNDKFTKVVVYVNSLEELLTLRDNAESIGIPTALMRDCGFTEFHGEETVTALAIGPDKSEKINRVTGDLPLL